MLFELSGMAFSNCLDIFLIARSSFATPNCDIKVVTERGNLEPHSARGL